ncbi:hypothetical protein WA026_021358 [Henosepilachna vigintioctopunctata]|uniref:Uncharacterized protein n=1 Tax=Henosepilachna vigintioctopunctata TaxID=420089 RepID=A0AAW1TYD2_9CUCU
MNFTGNSHFRHPFLRKMDKDPVTTDAALDYSLSSTVDYAISLSIDESFGNVDETNDVWYPVLFKTNTSFQFAEDISDSLYVNVYNNSNSSVYNNNGSLNTDQTLKLATTVGISFLFGVIILATIIDNRTSCLANILEKQTARHEIKPPWKRLLKCLILNKTYDKAATVQTSVNGFQKTGLWPVDPNVFPGYLFEPAETTNIATRWIESEEDSTAVENLADLSQVAESSLTSLTIASTSAADNPRPISAAQSRDIFTYCYIVISTPGPNQTRSG